MAPNNTCRSVEELLFSCVSGVYSTYHNQYVRTYCTICTVCNYSTYYMYTLYSGTIYHRPPTVCNCSMHGAGRVADAHCCMLYIMYIAVLTIALLVNGHLSLHGPRTVCVSQPRHSNNRLSQRQQSKIGTSDVVDVKPVKVCQLWRCFNMHQSYKRCM